MERPPTRTASGSPVSNPPTDDLLRQAQGGDDDALNRLFARYIPRLHRWAHRRVPLWARNAAETADYVQETVLQTWRHLGSFEPQGEGALRGYFRRSLLNRVKDQFRRASRHPVDTELEDRYADKGRSPLDLAIGAQDRTRYEAGLKRLKNAERQAIIGSLELGYNYEQLAVLLGKPSAEAARQAVRRALLRLGQEMARD